MPEKATFVGKPFNDRIILEQLKEKPPGNRQPEPLKHAV
jgi:hypothetical protein